MPRTSGPPHLPTCKTPQPISLFEDFYDSEAMGTVMPNSIFKSMSGLIIYLIISLFLLFTYLLHREGTPNGNFEAKKILGRLLNNMLKPKLLFDIF